MLSILREKLVEVLKAVGPLVGIACLLQLALVGGTTAAFVQFLLGSVLVVAGMVLLFMGVDLGILPMGRFIGAELPKKGSVALIVAVTFALGFAITVAEPDVLVLAQQVEGASQGAMSGHVVLYVIALGMAVFLAAAMARIVFGFPIKQLLAATFSLMLVLSLLTSPDLVPLAYDAGSVTTGVLTTPVVIALAGGLSAVLAGRSAMADGFGLLGFASIGPIIAILLMGFLFS